MLSHNTHHQLGYAKKFIAQKKGKNCAGSEITAHTTSVFVLPSMFVLPSIIM
jgi:hypothetical protein